MHFGAGKDQFRSGSQRHLHRTGAGTRDVYHELARPRAPWRADAEVFNLAEAPEPPGRVFEIHQRYEPLGNCFAVGAGLLDGQRRQPGVGRVALAAALEQGAAAQGAARHQHDKQMLHWG